jgi:Tol biopolymer transport system component/tRNA A-37 threonylcarbamoyl transferase component Bud32
MIGEYLAHYEILEKLGEGGMGIVYKGRDKRLDRHVAIKVLSAAKMANQDRKQRFMQEARAASALNHPNIITIYDFGQTDSADFIVMEYVGGKTLDRLIPSTGMRPTEALDYAVQITSALAAAHDAGIVHRDLKPGNVMITDKGQVKVLDFGLAKLVEPLNGNACYDSRTVIAAQAPTVEGTILGTVYYMSPEQAEGKRVDARSDVFSFGCLLYEMVTGRRAFEGDSIMSTVAAILKEEPLPATRVCEDLPPEIERAINRCLRKDPDRRFQHMADVRLQLQDLREEASSGQLPSMIARPAAARAPRRWFAMAAAAGILLLAAGYFTGRFFPSSNMPAWKVVPLTAYPGEESLPAISPDGNQAAFVWNGDKQDNYDIYVKLIGGGPPLRLTSDPAPESAPCWSPDGRTIAFLRGHDLLLVPALGGVARRLARFDSRLSDKMSWSADGRFIALGTPGLTLVATQTGQITRLVRNADPDLWDDHVTFSPDGRTLAFTRGVSIYQRTLHLWSLSRDGVPQGEPHPLIALEFLGLDWFPDSRHLLLSARTGSLVSLYRISARGGEPVPIPLESLSAYNPSVSRHQDRLVYQRRITDTNIFQIEGPGQGGDGLSRKPLVPLIASTYIDREPLFSPDGARILFSSTRTGQQAIWRADRDGSNQIQLVSSDGIRYGSARWSPDGQSIVFDGSSRGNSDLYLASSEGGSPQQLTSGPASDFRPSFSHNGQWIYFGSNRSGNEQIWRMPAKGGDPVRLTRKGGHEPFESADGTTLYYARRALPGGVWKMPVGGGEEALVLAEGTVGRWALATDAIYYAEPASPAEPARISVLRLSTGRKTVIYRFPGEVKVFGIATSFGVSPDERTILEAHIDRDESDLMLVENFR